MSEKQNNIETPPADRHCCFNCHFLVIKIFDGVNHKPSMFSAPQDAREECLKKQRLKNSFGHILACYKNVWKGEDFGSKGTGFILTGNKRDSCFFYPNIPSMDFSAAEILEHREANRREAEKDRKLTRRNANSARNTAIAAIIVAAVSVVVTIISVFCTPKKKHIVIDNEISVSPLIDADKNAAEKPLIKPSPTTLPIKK